MNERVLSANVLGPRASVSPNTINNYIRLKCGHEPAITTSGKQKSAKLTEIERIAAALKVSPLSLLQEQNEEEGTISTNSVKGRLAEEIIEVSESLTQRNQVLLLSLALALRGTDA